MIDDTLYFSTMFSRVVALDAETGDQKWVYDPRVYEDAPRGASPAGFTTGVWHFGETVMSYTCFSTVGLASTPSMPPLAS